MFNNPAAEAQWRTSLGNLNSGTDLLTKRMAGAALLAAIAPSVLSKIDNQEEGYLDRVLSSAITLGGVGTGAYMGHIRSQLTEAEKEQAIAQELNELKRKSKDTMKTDGPIVANEQYGEDKRRMLANYEPIDSNKTRRMLMEKATGFDLLGMTPRSARSVARGALMGGLASIPLAYMPLRRGEIDN